MSLAGYLEGYLTTELLPTGPPALAAWWIVHPRALSESSSDSEGPKTGCLEHLVPGSLRGGFGWQPALACGWPPFTQVTGLLAAFLAAGVDWRLSWFRMILDPRMIRMIICSWSSLEPGADLGVGSWSSVCLLCLCFLACDRLHARASSSRVPRASKSRVRSGRASRAPHCRSRKARAPTKVRPH